MAVVVQWTSRASPIHTLFTLFISVVQSGFRHTQGSAGPAYMLSGCSIEGGKFRGAKFSERFVED